MRLTVAYVTNRRNPRLQWFFDSLARQMTPDLDLRIIVVTNYYIRPEAPECFSGKYTFIAPHPNPYFGPYRLTKSDSFCAAVPRNTALCACETEYIAYVDDLSVLMPGWLDAVKHSMEQKRITFGAYKKVKHLNVVNGVPESYEEFPQGIDNRLAHCNGQPIQCGGQWLYGCSLVAPVEALLSVGGFCADLSGTLGFEDCLTGLALQNAGFSFWYDAKMLTLESEEAHFEEPPWFKTDKGTSPNDKSHKALQIVRNGLKYFENAMPEGGIRKVREDYLTGKGWPWPAIPVQPQHDWYDQQPLEEMG